MKYHDAPFVTAVLALNNKNKSPPLERERCVFMALALKPVLGHTVELLNSEPADVIGSSSVGNEKYSFK